MKIAALFVEKNGVYSEVENIELWDIERDARNYKGPHRVIAHPPCERWGRYWSGGPNVKVKRHLGDDGGMFAHAIWCVRTFGGILEHPEASHAWRWFGLQKPPKDGHWLRADDYGFTCCVEQGHYGHPARKATWIYSVGCSLRDFVWGKAEGKRRLDEGYHSTEERARMRALGVGPQKRLTRQEAIDTPREFRDRLIKLVQC